MTDKPKRERTAEDRVSDLERRVADLEHSVRVNDNCMLIVLGCLIGGLSPQHQRQISEILRTSGPTPTGAGGEEDMLTLVVQERIAEVADALDRFGDVYRELLAALARTRATPPRGSDEHREC